MASRWIIPITGFTESSRHQTGIEKLWRELRPLADHDTTLVTPFEWNDKFGDFLNYILRNSEDKPQVMIIAYSWGCGVGFTQLAKQALDVGVSIPIAVLCDPVYRMRFVPNWLQALALTPFPVIRVPASVRRVEWFRQKVCLPAGHYLVSDDPFYTTIEEPHLLDSPHTRIDDDPAFQKRAYELAYAFAMGFDFTGGLP